MPHISRSAATGKTYERRLQTRLCGLSAAPTMDDTHARGRAPDDICPPRPRDETQAAGNGPERIDARTPGIAGIPVDDLHFPCALRAHLLPSCEGGNVLRSARARRQQSGCRARAVRLILRAICCAGLLAGPAHSAAQSQTPAGANSALDISPHVREASLRFGMPEHWIYALIRVESAGRVRAVSPAGAMGLMQLMPGTWAQQRALAGLGTDPFDPRDNILAGTSYLREMFDRYGFAGFLAAYNAGPGRYEQWRAGKRALPPETRRYVARLTFLMQLLDSNAAPGAQIVSVSGDASAASLRPHGEPSGRPHSVGEAGSRVSAFPLAASASHDLFPPRSTVRKP